MYNCGVSPLSINMIFSYLSNRTHRTKISECFSERSRIEHGVPQGSILGPLLFNIDLIDLFYECKESNIASYADDTTPYSCARDTQTVISEFYSLDTGRKLNVHKTFRRRPGRFLNVLCTFNLRPVSRV